MTNITKPIGKRNRLVSKDEAKAMLEKYDKDKKQEVEQIADELSKQEADEVVNIHGHEIISREYIALTAIALKFDKIAHEYFNNFSDESQSVYIEIKDKHVTRLDMYSQSLEEIPEEVNRFVKLKCLGFASNKINEIKNIDNLIELEILDLGDNDLQEIGDISYLVKLQRLYVYKNPRLDSSGMQELRDRGVTVYS